MTRLCSAFSLAFVLVGLGGAVPAVGAEPCDTDPILIREVAIRLYPQESTTLWSVRTVTRQGWIRDSWLMRSGDHKAPDRGWNGPCYKAATPTSVLGQALARAHVGVATDCRTIPSSAALGRPELRVTWFGRGGKSHSFVASYDDSALPPCPPELESLFEVIFSLPDRDS